MNDDLCSLKFVRLERPATGSWITFVLPYEMPSSQAYDWLEQNIMPGWEAIGGSFDDPEEDCDL